MSGLGYSIALGRATPGSTQPYDGLSDPVSDLGYEPVWQFEVSDTACHDPEVSVGALTMGWPNLRGHHNAGRCHL
jgi:hypothetical protein